MRPQAPPAAAAGRIGADFAALRKSIPVENASKAQADADASRNKSRKSIQNARKAQADAPSDE
jgi:hypothetical protein